MDANPRRVVFVILRNGGGVLTQRAIAPGTHSSREEVAAYSAEIAKMIIDDAQGLWPGDSIAITEKMLNEEGL